MILGCGSGRVRCTHSTHVCQLLWPLWLRLLSQDGPARSVCAKATSRLLPLPRLPS